MKCVVIDLPFLLFGEGVGDSITRREDDGTAAFFMLSTPMVFYQQPQNILYVT